MAETQTKSIKGQDAEKAQEKKRRLELAPLPMKALADESVPFPGLLGDLAINPPVERHGAFLGEPRFSHSANNTQKARMVTELQQNYGNAYIQRVVGLIQARKDEALPEEEPDLADIVPKIAAEKGSGKPLEPDTRSEMKTAFGQDFSDVYIHTDAESNTLSQQLGAKAFTTGSDIFFREGAYQPGSESGQKLIAHELTHVVQQSSASAPQRLKDIPGAPEKLPKKELDVHHDMRSERRAEVLAHTPVYEIHRKPDGKPKQPTTTRQDVAIIVGRPSGKIARKETRKEKEQMRAWRSAAKALAPQVFEGLTVDKAFAGLSKIKTPIGKLYIIGHADESGVAEIDAKGRTVSTTVEDLTKRMRAATGSLGNKAPLSVEMLTCFGGGSPKTMGEIGKAVGAPTVRAPVWMTVITGYIPRLPRRQRVAKMSEPQLINIIKKLDILKHYDFVPGVPHPASPPSVDDKLKALASVLKKTGMIPYVSYNEEPGERDAVPYWKADIKRAKTTDELSPMDTLGLKGVVQVDVPQQGKKP